MTDEEIIKAIEICLSPGIPCDDCPLVEQPDCDEISRQYFYERFKELKAENAALRERLDKAPDNGKCFIKELHENGRVLYVISRYKVITSYICTELTPEAAIARLREFRGGKE